MYLSFIKPLIDFILALLSIIFLFPIFIIVGIAIKLDSKGPIFFVQQRLGKDKKSFGLIKFRTMTDKHRDAYIQTYEKDSEITAVGGFLRRTKIDEFPQLFNILRGDMAVVGPRPCLEKVAPKFGEEGQKRFLVKPGLSSLAALKGSIYLKLEEKGYWDAYYLDNLSCYMDLKIILGTISIMIVGEKRYVEKNKR